MVITVQCPSCATSFPVDPRKIPEKGVKVRCSSCSQVFRVERPAEAAPPPPPPAPVAEVTAPPPAPPAPAPVEPPPMAPMPPAAPEPVVDEAPHFWATAETPVAEEAPPVSEAPPAEEAPPVEEPPAEEAPPVEEPRAEEAPPVEEPRAEEAPAEEPVAEHAAPGPVSEEPVAEEPVVEEPVEEPVAEPPAAAEPVAEERDAPRDVFADWPSGTSWDARASEVSTTMEEAADAAAHDASGTTEEAAEEVTGGAAALASGSVDDWVMETEDDLDPSSLEIGRMDTVQSSVEGIRDEMTFSDLPSDFETGAAGVMDVPQVEEPAAPPFEVEPPPTPTFHEPAPPPPPPPPPPEPMTFTPAAPVAPPTPEPAPSAGSAGVGAFTFGKRDPKDKARRLARVLVSDMIMYNPERHERALANGTLKEDFEDEIKKSWKEYVEQVGEEMAQGNNFWTDALNDVLAKGERVF